MGKKKASKAADNAKEYTPSPSEYIHACKVIKKYHKEFKSNKATNTAKQIADSLKIKKDVDIESIAKIIRQEYHQ